jgi:hypothetical protein
MKTIFLFVAMIAASLTVKAQGNLQFNQVKLIDTSSTVPTGKVWKVESVLHGDNSSWSFGSPSTDCIMSIKINGSNVCLSRLHTYAAGGSLSNSAAASESAFNCTSFPIWLPEGGVIDLGFNSKFISIIEYNLVP